jgi:hypothetical protein
MIYSVQFAETGLTVQYAFIASDFTLAAALTATGVAASAFNGQIYKVSATAPEGALGIYWQVSGDSTVFAFELFTDIAALTAQIAELETAIAALAASGQVTIASPVAADGEEISIDIGDSYSATDDRALDFTNIPWDLTAATVTLDIAGHTFTGSVLTASSCRFELTEAQTAALPVGLAFRFYVRAELGGSRRATVVRAGRAKIYN